MPYADMREFMARLEREGELLRVKTEVDPVYEIGAIARRVLDCRGPALLFEKVKGSAMPLVINLLASRRRYTWACDLTPETFHRGWVERTGHPVEPVTVQTAPCKEVILKGDEVDLYKLPIPIWNELDGGPFLTMSIHFSRDPESGIGNAAIYRNQVHDRTTLGVQIVGYRHIRMHATKVKGGAPLPVAIALGVDPSIIVGAVGQFTYGVDEITMAGALRQKPVEMVRCESVPLEVPASSEIVLEGELFLDETRMEGLFGEFTGYYGVKAPRPIMKVHLISHRRDAICIGSYEGRPFHETNLLQGMPAEAVLLKQVGMPELLDVYVPEGGCTFMAIAKIRKEFEGQGKWVGMNILGDPVARIIKTVIVVDDDIDIRNWTDVIWALNTRVQAHRDIEIIKEVTGCALDPSIPLGEREFFTSRTSKVLIDATKYDAHEFEIACAPHPDAAAFVAGNWQRYGIDLSPWGG